MSIKTIYLDNDWEPCWSGTRNNTLTGESEAATGLTVTARLSLTKGGAAIHADLSKSLTERTSTPGEYFATVDGDVLRTRLLLLVGTVIYEVFGDGTNVLYSAPRRVVLVRTA